MKRFVTFITLLVMLLSMSVNAFAAANDFVASIGEKSAPQLVVTEKDGKKVIGYITAADGTRLSEECEECILITPVSEAEKSTKIPEQAKKTLLSLYEEMRNPDKKLSDIFKSLENADNYVVRDLFDISALCDDIPTKLKDDAVLDLTFKNVTPGVPLTVMVYVNGEWMKADTKTNDDGTVTVYFKNVGAVAFLVPEGTPGVTPDTGDTFNLTFWVTTLVASLVMIAVLVTVILRKRNTEK